MQFKSLQFIRHLLICNCTTVSGFVRDSSGWCLQGQQGQQQINTTTLHSHSGQELTNTRLQEKPRESKTRWPKIPPKESNVQTRSPCCLLEGQSKKRLKWSAQASQSSFCVIQEPENWSLMFSLHKQGFANSLLRCLSMCNQCPSVRLPTLVPLQHSSGWVLQTSTSGHAATELLVVPQKPPRPAPRF